MHRPHRSAPVRSLALSGVLCLGLTACGGDDPAEGTTAPVTSAAPTVEEPAATTEEPAEETTEEAATTEDETTEATTEAESADGVPELTDIWPNTTQIAQDAEAVAFTVVGSTPQGDIDADVRGQLDDSNYEARVQMDDMEVTIIMAEGVHYVRGNTEFWAQAGAPATLADTWISVPEEMGLGDSFSLATLWGDFGGAMPTDTGDLQTSSAELTELDGEEVYHYVIESEDAQIWIAADGTDELRRIELGGDTAPGDEPMVITTSDWDDVDPVEAPEESTPIEEVMGGTGG